MAKIRDAIGRGDGGSYARIFDNVQLGLLISKIQATSIRNGNELEKLIVQNSHQIENLDDFIKRCQKVSYGVYLCPKKTLKKSQFANGQEPDMLVFIIGDTYLCKIIELKDGDNFDTKKAKGEKEALIRFRNHLAHSIPFETEYYICCFNQNNKETIFQGFKKEFEKDEILTGRELCRVLNIDFDNLVNYRKEDAEDNFIYFLEELLKISKVRDYLSTHFFENSKEVEGCQNTADANVTNQESTLPFMTTI